MQLISPLGFGTGNAESTTGSSKKALPFAIHHLLNLLDLLVREMAKTTLKLQILFDRNDTRFLLKGIGPSIFDFIEGKNP